MLTKNERVGWQDVGHRGAKIFSQLDLTAGVARACGNGQTAQPFRAKVDARPPVNRPYPDMF